MVLQRRTHTSVRSQHRRTRLTRDLVELAALLLSAGAAHLFVVSMQTHQRGSWSLIGLGAALLVTAAIHRWWTHHRTCRLPDPTPRDDSDRFALPELRDRRAPALWQLRTSVADTPGRLARLTAELALLGGDIRAVQVHPTVQGAVDEIFLHVPPHVHEEQLRLAAARAGGHDVTATRADIRELDDVPTRVISLATDLVDGRRELPRVLRGLLGRIDVRWQEEPEAALATDGLGGNEMCVPAPGGGVFVLHRSHNSFTPAELARATALSRLGVQCRTRSDSRDESVTLPDGTVIAIRLADRADVPLLTALHALCTGATLHRRYFSTGVPVEADLRRLLTPALGRSILALTSDGEVAGMGNLVYDGESADFALLVRDDWQGRGLGTALADHLIEQARKIGLDELDALTQLDNTAAARTLRSAGFKLTGVGEPGEWSWTRDLRDKAARRYVVPTSNSREPRWQLGGVQEPDPAQGSE